jgi:hypothetical protein
MTAGESFQIIGFPACTTSPQIGMPWRAQPDRTVFQQDQAMSARRDPIRQTRGQLSGIHQARINPHLVGCI